MLNDKMEMDCPVVVDADGNVSAAPNDVHAPEVYWADGLEAVDKDWELLEGYTGQYGYNGPVMHVSEYIGGMLERDILATPGTYVAVVVDDILDDDSDEPVGWVIARLVA